MNHKNYARNFKDRLLVSGGIFVGCTGLFVASSIAHAQTDTGGQSAEAATPSGTIEDIVVTAQKRTERLQNVPISAQVVSGQALVAKNQTTLENVAQTLPGVHIGSNGPSNDMYIRGIGSGGAQSFDQSVATFIDGIYHGRSRNSAATFMDLERIEVLKGPQTTFFGNNAIAGALNITSAKPGDIFSGYGRVLFGGHGHYAAEGAVNTPISDALALRVAGTLNGSSGWIDNVTLDRRIPVQRNYAGRATLSYHPNESFDATLKVEASRSKQTGAAQDPVSIAYCPPPAPFVASGNCAAALSLGVPLGVNSEKTLDGALGQGNSLKSFETVFSLNYHVGDFTLSSVTGYYKYKFDYRLDADFLPSDQVALAVPEKYHQFSQELRILSPVGKPIEFIAGAYFQSDKLEPNTQVYFPIFNAFFGGTPFEPFLPLAQASAYKQNEKVYSAFASASWNATDKLKLTAAVRGSWVDKDYVRTVTNGTGVDFGPIVGMPLPLQEAIADLLGTPPGTVSGKRKDHGWQPSARVQYQFTPEVMAYASFTRGFKAGGFSSQDGSPDPVTSMPYNPEHVNAYEIGLKSRLFDNRVLFNVAAFLTDYSDLQVSVHPEFSQASTILVTRNAAKSRSKGVEVETQWAVTPELRLTVNGAYLDSRYVNYVDGSPTALQSFLGATSQDLSGRPTEFAPKWSASVNVTYRMPVGNDYHITLDANPYFSSSYYISAVDDQLARQPAYARLDGRIAFDGPNDRWGIDLIAHNLTNTTVREISGNLAGAPGSSVENKQETRYFAVQARMKW